MNCRYSWASKFVPCNQLDSIKTYKGPDFAMMREASSSSYQLFTLQQGDLAWGGGNRIRVY